MLDIKAKCDHCGKGKRISSSSVIPEHFAIISLLKKIGWIITDCKHFCSWKCEEDYQLTCEHVPIKKDGYTECADCGKIWQPDYDLMLEGK